MIAENIGRCLLCSSYFHIYNYFTCSQISCENSCAEIVIVNDRYSSHDLTLFKIVEIGGFYIHLISSNDNLSLLYNDADSISVFLVQGDSRKLFLEKNFNSICLSDFFTFWQSTIDLAKFI